MNSSIEKVFISTREASLLSGYTSDYLGRLCRENKIDAMRSGRTWIIDRVSLVAFIASQQANNAKRAEELTRTREREYAAAQKRDVPIPRGPSKSAEEIWFPIRQQAFALSAAFLVVLSGLAFAGGATLLSPIEASQKTLALLSQDGWLSRPYQAYVAIGTGSLAALSAGLDSYATSVHVAGSLIVASVPSSVSIPTITVFDPMLATIVRGEIRLGSSVIALSGDTLELYSRGAYAWAEGSEVVPAHVIAFLYGVGSATTDAVGSAPHALATLSAAGTLALAPHSKTSGAETGTAAVGAVTDSYALAPHVASATSTYLAFGSSTRTKNTARPSTLLPASPVLTIATSQAATVQPTLAISATATLPQLYKGGNDSLRGDPTSARLVALAATGEHLAKTVYEALQGLFTTEVHTDRICVKKSDGTEFCANGDELEALAAVAAAEHATTSTP